CDVVLYSPEHNLTFAELPLAQVNKVVALWQSRFTELAADRRIRYIQIFENKGATIGVTIPHPHGQIYAFPYVPPRIQRKLDNAEAYFRETRRDLWGTTLKAELRARQRIVAAGEHFVAFVPFAAHWPYEVHVAPKRHMSDMSDMSDPKRREFSALLKTITMKYDNLIGYSFPYMMVLYNAPVNESPGQEEIAASGFLGKIRDRPRNDRKGAWRFHVEFYPPFRAADKLKFRAGVETGAGSFINDSIPEEKAADLRKTKPSLAQVLAGADHRHFPPPPAGFCP
ncbi:MAG: galactose-1-phosphate uridylyltransferase, partial [bacterium]